MTGRLLLAVSCILVLAVPVAPATHSQGCEPEQGSYTGESNGVYVWITFAIDGHVDFGAWQETNGIDGLQRWDPVFDETCGGHYPADTEIVAWYMI